MAHSKRLTRKRTAGMTPSKKRSEGAWQKWKSKPDKGEARLFRIRKKKKSENKKNQTSTGDKIGKKGPMVRHTGLAAKKGWWGNETKEKKKDLKRIQKKPRSHAVSKGPAVGE